MAYIEVNGRTYELDCDGHLADWTKWHEGIAIFMAQKDGHSNLSCEQWEIIRFLRDYFNEYQISPPPEILMKKLGKEFGPEKGSQEYLYALYPYPAIAHKYAGIPKPTG